ncbi:uncharacterized protein LOC119073265 [Bradysia coprophila]|uniref:uncharacterized protein LOC119073265 n=1 Tax=Bradysia coprophila TaxID=38358 RepID=UPI00187D6F83|nr:uncharacterized protein LOC119073265 [Bradysia coprophila]
MTKSAETDTSDIPIIDVQKYMNNVEAKEQCKKVVQSLHEHGILIVKDTRATQEDNDSFINVMEQYFEQTDFTTDARPNFSYQIGVTPELKERPRNHCARIAKLDPMHQPVTLCPPQLDKKSRFYWRIGKRPENTKFKELNAEPVIPAGFPEWPDVMNTWGDKMLATLHVVASMAAEGFGLEKDIFHKKMTNGPHLLAPTGSNFNRYGTLGTVLAGYHYDLSFLTIHGKCRFPGLYIWSRNGRKILVRVPDGCLLVQAGKEMEYLTGGYVRAGFHEVVVSKETVEAIEKRAAKQQSLWRVSSTLFAHIASDLVLQPLDSFKTEESLKMYPAVLAGDQVQAELNLIELGTGYTLNR